MPREIVYLVSLKTLKEYYGFDENLEDAYILPNIKKCQDVIIRPLLGETLWAEIIAEIKASTVSILHDELIKEYLEPVIAYYVKSELVYNTAYKLKNKGTEDDSNSERFNELVRLSKKYLIDSDQYQSRLKQWMCLYTNIPQDPLYQYKTNLYLGNLDAYDYHNQKGK